MAFAVPGTGKEKERGQYWGITSGVMRGIISEVISLDLREFVEGTIGNLLGISRGLFLVSIFSGLVGVLWHLVPNLPIFALAWILGTLPIWFPAVSIVLGWKAWTWYVQTFYISNKEAVLLEIKMPRELVKSPRGMEVALSQLWIFAGETTYFSRKWLGQVRPIFSMEIASFGGEVHFYFWTWEEWKSSVESAIYAQYPEVEIEVVEDYASKFVYDPSKMRAFCTDMRYEPRNDAYPIKTYIEFELDEEAEEEYKIDPLAQIVERLSVLRPDEQIWLQIVFTMNMEDRPIPHGRWWESENRYVALCHHEVENIRKELVGDMDNPAEKWKSYSRVQLHSVNETIRLIQRNMAKHAYHTGVRGVFISNPEHFTGAGIHSMRWIWLPMGNHAEWNQMRPRRWHTPFDYPYQDLWSMRWNLHARRFFDCYRRRAHFYSPYMLPDNVMSTEVLATFWHPLSTAIASPGIERIPSKKAEPPSNLPT